MLTCARNESQASLYFPLSHWERGRGEGLRRANSPLDFVFELRAPRDIQMKRERQYRGGYQLAGLSTPARELRRKQTSAEALLWQLPRDRQLLGFKFRRQHQFGDYVIDFYCREARLVIECDGSAHESNERWHHDQERDAYMTGQGVRVLRFPNDRILSDPASVLEEIAEHLPAEK